WTSGGGGPRGHARPCRPRLTGPAARRDPGHRDDRHGRARLPARPAAATRPGGGDRDRQPDAGQGGAGGEGRGHPRGLRRARREMLARGDVDAVVNLTPIAAHFETSLRILAAGKHLVTEKPLASTLAQAGELIEAAGRGGLLIVCAPMDILKREWAQARRLI